MRSQLAIESIERLLEAACAQQSPAELHFERGNGELIVARVRLLTFSDNQLLADRPIYEDSGHAIPLGRPLKVHVAIRQSRFEFDSVIESQFRRAPGHSPWTGSGIVLRRPTSVRPSQRRANVRVSVLGCDPIAILAATPCPSGAHACALDGPVYHGWMVDVSAGGLSMVVDRQAGCRLRRGDRLFLWFELPAMDEAFVMLGSVRHTRPVADGESIRLAVAFRNWAFGPLRSQQQSIARFVARQERTHLKRKR